VQGDPAEGGAANIKSSKLYFIHSAVPLIFFVWLGETFWSVKFTVVADDVLLGLIVLAHDGKFFMSSPGRWSSLMVFSASVCEL
jgi:hypothetical protein